MGSVLDCDDNNSCTEDSCDDEMGICVHSNAAGPCDNGNVCITDDVCVDGVCQVGVTLDCDDSDPCFSDACDP